MKKFWTFETDVYNYIKRFIDQPFENIFLFYIRFQLPNRVKCFSTFCILYSFRPITKITKVMLCWFQISEPFCVIILVKLGIYMYEMSFYGITNALWPEGLLCRPLALPELSQSPSSNSKHFKKFRSWKGLRCLGEMRTNPDPWNTILGVVQNCVYEVLLCMHTIHVSKPIALNLVHKSVLGVARAGPERFAALGKFCNANPSPSQLKIVMFYNYWPSTTNKNIITVVGILIY